MAKTPFFGPFDITRSSNLADNQLINLRPEIVETHDGKNVGALMGTPGLSLLVAAGSGGINGFRQLGGQTLYVVSGDNVYSIGLAAWTATLVGTVAAGGQVSIIDNGKQFAIFAHGVAWCGPAGVPLTGGSISVNGYPLTGGTIGSGSNFAIGDTITLAQVGGVQTTPAILQVTGVTAGVPTSIFVLQAGAFSTQPTSFTQDSTSNVGVNFTLTSPTFGTIIQGGINYAVDDTIVLLPDDGAESAAAILTVTGATNGGVTAFTILQTGAFQTNPTGFKQKYTSGSGSDFILTSPTYGGSVALCSIALPFSGVNQTISATYQDGFGLCTQPGTMTIWQTLFGDLSVWPALNFATAAGESDNVVALMSLHRLIFVVKQRTTEVWSDAGLSGFAFQQIGTVLIEYGTIAWNTVQKIGEGLMFLAQNEQGQGEIVELEGFRPVRRSTHAIETMLGKASRLDNAFAFTYQQDGHLFYVLTLPSDDLTLVYDKTTSMLTQTPMWYQWLSFAAGKFSRHWANCAVMFNQTSIVGDYRNGNIYKVDLGTLTDNGVPRKWLRSWRALQTPVMMPMRFSSLQIDMQTGIDVPDGTSPQVMLEWSDDGGHNWSSQVTTLAGAPGVTTQRVRFNRLGSTKRNGGLDRIFRLSSADSFPVALIGADLDV